MSLHMLEHAFMHSAQDTIKLIPLLFLTYLAMEYLERRAGEKTVAMLLNTGKRGPVIGGLLGVVPQCGFSAAAANLYAGGVITVGTMVAVFLSTSDEMLPILISGKADMKEILFILTAKVVIGVIAGILVDMVVRQMNGGRQKGLHIQEICEKEHCHCEEGGIIKPALMHCLHIIVFIFIVSFVLNVVIEWIGMEHLIEMAAAYPVASIFFVGAVGLIPNCATSVAITTLYLEGVLSMGSMFAGLLSCAGVGLVILFRMNPNWKKNIIIVGGIYIFSVLGGIFMEFILFH